jgi:phage FluMu protein Com
MFCPKCGNELVRVGESLTCIEGKMVLDHFLEKRLTECYVSRVDTPRERRFSFQVGGTWFCPGCGVAAVESDGFVRCPECKLLLNEFIPRLVEIHPHKRKSDTNDWPNRNA